MTAPAPDADDRAATLRGRTAFLRLAAGRTLSGIALQMVTVSLGWQLYNLTNNPLDLGLVGLAQFIPMILSSPFAGIAADRFDRRHVGAVCAVTSAAVALFLALATHGGWITRTAIFASVGTLALVRAFDHPTMSALLPLTVPRAVLAQATAFFASAFQTAVIVGPALGGLLFAWRAAAPYALATACFLVTAVMMSTIRSRPQVRQIEPVTRDSLLAGARFIWRTPEILGAMSLDLAAFALGAAVALLPIVARDVLGTDSTGLGLLRAAPAVGALLMSAWLARNPMRANAGLKMFGGVMLFGAATVVFGLSQSFLLSLGAMAVLGAADVVSVVVRQSLVQLRTPDDMRGRVGAVNAMFIASSNQLGDLRAGVMAAAVGAVPAIVLGGLSAMAVAGLWMWLFPSLVRMQRPEGAGG